MREDGGGGGSGLGMPVGALLVLLVVVLGVLVDAVVLARVRARMRVLVVVRMRMLVGVRVIVIRAPRDLLPKGWPWWRAPRFPAAVDVTLMSELELQPGETANDLTARTNREFLAALASP